MNEWGIDRRNLAAHLKMVVPFWVIELSNKGPDYWAKRREICATVIGEKGDVIIYGSKKTGRAGEAFNRLAEGIAISMLMAEEPFELFGLRFDPKTKSIEDAI